MMKINILYCLLPLVSDGVETRLAEIYHDQAQK